jgi:hypothetical protein
MKSRLEGDIALYWRWNMCRIIILYMSGREEPIRYDIDAKFWLYDSKSA